ncbi:MAG TPA: hypothetical protein VK179_18110 [Bacteroidales bacterium]|nr:hypothetical protein [Bacteroidales bacterium]
MKYLIIYFGLMLSLLSNAQHIEYKVVNDYLKYNSRIGLPINLYYCTSNSFILERNSLGFKRSDFGPTILFTLKEEKLIDSIFNEIDTLYMISQMKQYADYKWVKDSLIPQVSLYKNIKRVHSTDIHGLSFPIFTNSKKRVAFIHDSTYDYGTINILCKENNIWVVKFLTTTY